MRDEPIRMRPEHIGRQHLRSAALGPTIAGMRASLTIVAHHGREPLRCLEDLDWREPEPGVRIAPHVRTLCGTVGRAAIRAPRDRHPPACACCRVDSVGAHLREATALAAASATLGERWIVDASGRDDLASVADRIVNDDVLRPKLHFDGIVVVRPRPHAGIGPGFEVRFTAQSAVADRVIDSTHPALDELRGVPLVDVDGRCRPDAWLPDAPEPGPALSFRAPELTPAPSIRSLDLDDLQLPPAPQLTLDWLSAWLARVAARAGTCLRVKAVFNVAGYAAPLALHALGGRWQPPLWLSGAIGPQRSRCSLVLRSPQPMSPPSTIRFVAVQ